jgi:hypothetical protein
MGKVQRVKNEASKACKSPKTNGWAGKIKKAIGKKPSVFAAKKADQAAVKELEQANKAIDEEVVDTKVNARALSRVTAAVLCSG